MPGSVTVAVTVDRGRSVASRPRRRADTTPKKTRQESPKGGYRHMSITRHVPTGYSRRDMIRGSLAAMMGGYGLAPRYGLAANIPYEFDGSKFQMAAPEASPKR